MMYRVLARRYKWTFDYIASLTPYRQLVALQSDDDVGAGSADFDSMDEYELWYNENFKNGKRLGNN